MVTASRLHVVYRSTAGDNAKPRPPYYDKATCLLSFARAAGECSRLGDVVFLNVDDAPWPQARLDVMARLGRVERIADEGMGASYRRCLQIVSEASWPETDLVYLAEDDYLLDPSAFSGLLEAADALPDVHYFALYAAVLGEPPNGTDLPSELRVPSSLYESEPRAVSSGTWRRAVSSNLSTGARISALHRDRWMHAAAPRAGAWFDHFLALAVQGELPCTARQLLLPLAESPHLSRRLRISAWRALLTAGALAHRGRPHRLAAAVPPLACHLETGYLAAGRDWEQLASQTLAWARAAGLPVPVESREP